MVENFQTQDAIKRIFLKGELGYRGLDEKRNLFGTSGKHCKRTVHPHPEWDFFLKVIKRISVTAPYIQDASEGRPLYEFF